MVKLGIYLAFTLGFLHPDALVVSSLTRPRQTGSPISSARFLPAPHTTLATLTNVLFLEHAKHIPSLVTALAIASELWNILHLYTGMAKYLTSFKSSSNITFSEKPS